MRALSRHPVLLLLLACIAVFGVEVARRFEVVKGDAPGLSIQSATFLPGDCRAYQSTTRGIVTRQSIDPREVMYDRDRYTDPPEVVGDLHIANSNAAVTSSGRFVPKHPLLFSLALVPSYVLAGEVGMLGFNVALCISLVLTVFGLARLRHGPWPSFLAGLTFLLLSPIRPYSYNVSPDVFGALLLLGGMWGALRAEAPRWRVLAGVALGLSVWMRPFNAVGVVGLLPLWPDRRRLAEALLGVALGVGAFCSLNIAWFHDPLVTTYHRTYVVTDGVASLADHRDWFTRPFLESIVPTLFDPRVGLLRTAPYWPLVVPYLWRMRADRAWVVPVAVLAAAHVVTLIPYAFWATSTDGNRFFFVPAAITAVCAAGLVEPRRAGRQLNESRPPKP